MLVCILDGTKIRDRESLHQSLAKQLGFPDWYGGNLDALHDCLTDISEETQIVVRHREELKRRLGAYAACFLKVLMEASLENSRIEIVEKEDY